jgi:hypothetical protein
MVLLQETSCLAGVPTKAGHSICNAPMLGAHHASHFTARPSPKVKATIRHKNMNTKIKIIGTAVLCFVAGFALDRLLTYREVKRLQHQVEAGMEKLFGFEQGEGKKLVGTLSQHMTSDELAQVMIEMKQMGSQQKMAQSDALATTYSLLFYVKLQSGETNVANQRAASQIAKFYNSYKNVTFTDGRLGQTVSGLIKRIEKAMEKYPDLKQTITNAEQTPAGDVLKASPAK